MENEILETQYSFERFAKWLMSRQRAHNNNKQAIASNLRQ